MSNTHKKDTANAETYTSVNRLANKNIAICTCIMSLKQKHGTQSKYANRKYTQIGPCLTHKKETANAEMHCVC